MERKKNRKQALKKTTVKCLKPINIKLLVLEGEKYLPLALITFLKRRNKIPAIIFILGKMYKMYRPHRDSELGSD